MNKPLPKVTGVNAVCDSHKPVKYLEQLMLVLGKTFFGYEAPPSKTLLKPFSEKGFNLYVTLRCNCTTHIERPEMAYLMGNRELA